MSLEEIDDLFYLLENPTRRRILQLLSRERLYPLQLSREIDVSQQAVVKHLRILEEHGMVASRDEPSDRGPNRRVYRASRSVSLHIDVGPTTFREQAAPMAEDAELSAEQLRIRSAISEARSMEPSARMDLLARVGEGDHHAGLQHHIGAELMALERLYVIRVVLAKGFLGRHLEAVFVASFHTHQVGLEILRQVVIADFQGGRLFLKGRINHFAIRELQGEMQFNAGTLIDRQFIHKSYSLLCASPSESAGLRNISRIIMAAPMVMAVSARLKAGKCRSCQ